MISIIYQAYNQNNLVFNPLNYFLITNKNEIFSYWEDIIKIEETNTTYEEYTSKNI